MNSRSVIVMLLLGATCAANAAALAQQPAQSAIAPSAVEQEVLVFERLRLDAVLKRDVRALAAMMADDVSYVHASGLKQNKEQYLAYVSAGNVTYTSYEIEHPVVQVLGDAAVTHGIFNYEIASHSIASHGSMLYTAVYVRTQGKWQLTSWEATARPAQP